jgi:hypothetical protein
MRPVSAKDGGEERVTWRWIHEPWWAAATVLGDVALMAGPEARVMSWRRTAGSSIKILWWHGDGSRIWVLGPDLGFWQTAMDGFCGYFFGCLLLSYFERRHGACWCARIRRQP